MNNADRVTWIILTILLLATLTSGLFWDQFKPIPPTAIDDAPIHPSMAQLSGGTNPGAPITIVEFGDYQCPNTNLQRPVLNRILTEHPTMINFIHKNFPSQLHDHAMDAAKAATCVKHLAPDQFPAFEDTLFAHQDALDPPHLIEYATDLGISQASFQSCLEDPSTTSLIQRDIDLGVTEGVIGTPTLFINGKPFSGFQPYAKLKVIIESLVEVEQSKKGPTP